MEGSRVVIITKARPVNAPTLEGVATSLIACPERHLRMSNRLSAFFPVGIIFRRGRKGDGGGEAATRDQGSNDDGAHKRFNGR